MTAAGKQEYQSRCIKLTIMAKEENSKLEVSLCPARNGTCSGTLQTSLTVNAFDHIRLGINRPFAGWRRFTTTTRILYVFPFIF